MVECAAGNLRRYGELMYAEQKGYSAKPRSVNISNIDAQYCFQWGHCNNTEVTESTTVAEMEQMCDARFGGRQEWTENFHLIGGLSRGILGGVFSGGIRTNLKHPMQVTVDMGFLTAFAKMACAMGNYHCDVVYCKQQYCSDPAWKAQYGHLSKPPPPRSTKPLRRKQAAKDKVSA
mmetsp:Transcript_61068/g.137600  ORF Transcript_61068/g.137600 Transcript_61068/m.137600 type:complete len:176 (-) Transcript_61068:119-646(-)